MYDFNYPKNMNIGKVTLELSLKPFKCLDDEYIETVCRRLFTEWKPLLKYADSAAVMLWTSDGSEILEYSGNLDDEFEWCRFIGIGNPAFVDGEAFDFNENNLHIKPVLYCENPPVMHYSDLKRIISALKKIGKEILGIPVLVGETFDPGPEFAYSDFKFNRHAEINKGKVMDAWIHCAATLNADDKHYAAFPDGIPEGTQIGEFIAKQFSALKEDVGFDYLWLSNGFGFSLDSWNWRGETFDGKEFSANAPDVRNAIKDFWDSYTPNTDFVTEVRGSNLSTGMDIAAHGCPIDYIYSNNITAPPNSPWAAIDFRFGLELVGYMSHIAKTPDNGYGFRYYTHDPWWLNSPWFDRYQRSPHDIYLPLAITRMNENGTVQKPANVNFLSADDSFGELPEKCPIEVIPHILEGFRTYPDSPGALTWLYPFDYYCSKGLYENAPQTIFMDDWFMEQAVDFGLPVSTVVSDGVFINSDMNVYKETVIVTPVPDAETEFEKCVMKALDAGIPVILYGSAANASDELKKYIGVTISDGISGELSIRVNVVTDSYKKGVISDKIYHVPLVSNGEICEIASETVDVLASVSDGKSKRAYSTYNKAKKLVWVRASFPHNAESDTALPELYSTSDYFPASSLLRFGLSKLGYGITFDTYSTEDKLPLILLSRNNGGFVVTSFSKDETVTTKIKTPYGAPVINNTTAMVKASESSYNLPKWLREYCRVFVKQEGESKVSCQVRTAGDTMQNDRRIVVSGLDNAVLTFMPERNSTVTIYKGAEKWPVGSGDIGYETDGNGYIITPPLTGDYQIVWQNRDTREKYKRLGYFN